MRLVLLTEIPAPYRIPLFNALAGLDGIDLRVVYLRERHPDRFYRLHREELRFSWRILPGLERTVRGRWLLLNAGIGREVRRADVVILGGWNQPAFWQALAWARLRRKPTAVWVESTARDARTEAPAVERGKSALAAAADAFVVPGSAARDYVRSLGVGDDRIAVAPNAVDLSIFRDRVVDARDGRERLRRELGLERCAFLSVGRLSPEKGIEVLVRAIEGIDADLLVAGAGPEEERLRELAPASVRFLGNVERDDLVPLYAAVDAFVLPSRSDTWGMALSEAAAAGLPLVASEAAGAAHDLVEDGVNGFRVPAGDGDALREALRRIAADPELRAAAGRRSLELSERHSPEAWAAAVRDLAAKLLG